METGALREVPSARNVMAVTTRPSYDYTRCPRVGCCDYCDAFYAAVVLAPALPAASSPLSIEPSAEAEYRQRVSNVRRSSGRDFRTSEYIAATAGAPIPTPSSIPSIHCFEGRCILLLRSPPVTLVASPLPTGSQLVSPFEFTPFLRIHPPSLEVSL